MDELANYLKVVEEVINELKIQIEKATKAGINRNKIVIDPGLGFAKKPEHNWQLLKEISKLFTKIFSFLAA